jgi:hypothetical protein
MTNNASRRPNPRQRPRRRRLLPPSDGMLAVVLADYGLMSTARPLLPWLSSPYSLCYFASCFFWFGYLTASLDSAFRWGFLGLAEGMGCNKRLVCIY